MKIPLFILHSFLLFLGNSDAFKMALFVPSVANSQVQFCARVAETLLDGGHDVTMILVSYMTDFQSDVRIPEGVKIHHVDSSGSGYSKADNEKQQAEILFEDVGLLGMRKIARVMGNVTNMMKQGCRRTLQNKNFLNWMRSSRFDLVFAYVTSSCDLGITYASGIPTWAWLNSGPLLDHVAKTVGVPIVPSFVPPIMMESTDEMGFLQRVKSWVGHAITIRVYRWVMADEETRIFREELNDPEFPHVLDIASKCPLVFVNTNELYDLPRPTLAKVINIGGLGVGFESAKPLDAEFKRITETGKGVVVFSFGSVAGAHEMPLKWKNSLLEAFASFPDYQFVMRYVADDLNERLPNNVHLFKWLPQKDLLLNNNTKAFITHGGYNSLQEAISAGMPLVTIALIGDQPKNAMLAKKRGFAVNIAKSTLSKETIVEALREVLTNPRYKQNAQRYSAMVRAQPMKPSERLLKWAEFLAEFKHLENLEPAGQKLNFLQYHSVDVILFLATILIVSLLIFLKVSHFLTRKTIGLIRKAVAKTKTE